MPNFSFGTQLLHGQMAFGKLHILHNFEETTTVNIMFNIFVV